MQASLRISMTRIRTYSELRRLDTFEERFKYLQTFSKVGMATFGFERYLNQRFYNSAQWRHVRNEVIARDQGRDMGVEGYEIFDKVIIHHMNPMNVDQITEADDSILNPDYLVTVSFQTHNAIHYGDASLLRKPFVARRPGDTKLW
jgi:hypothetical protein